MKPSDGVMCEIMHVLGVDGLGSLLESYTWLFLWMLVVLVLTIIVTEQFRLALNGLELSELAGGV